MQISVNIPDELIQEFREKYTEVQQKKMFKEMVEKDLKEKLVQHKDPFIEWLMKPAKRIKKDKSNNIAENHDKHIYF